MKAHDDLLRALADPTRRQIFESLRSGPRAVGELAAGFPVSRPAVSQHLKILKQAGLVRERRQGTRVFYSINPRGLEPLRTYLENFWGEVLTAFESAATKGTGGRNE